MTLHTLGAQIEKNQVPERNLKSAFQWQRKDSFHLFMQILLQSGTILF